MAIPQNASFAVTWVHTSILNNTRSRHSYRMSVSRVTTRNQRALHIEKATIGKPVQDYFILCHDILGFCNTHFPFLRVLTILLHT